MQIISKKSEFSCIYRKKAVPLRKFLFYMRKPDWKLLWQNSRKYLLNKYLITLLVFAVILTFCGNQSVINRVKMAREIRVKKAELREYHRKIDEAESDLRNLANPDSLERFAREHYHMHTPEEDVYLIDE